MAAATEAEPGSEAGSEKKSSLVVQLGVLAGLTLVAVGTGWFAGTTLRGEVPPSEGQPAATASADGHGKAGESHGEPTAEGEATPLYSDPTIIDLIPITTNLAAPSDIWVRAEMAVHFTRQPADDIPDAIQQDILGYLRTVKLHQIEGPSGFQHLKADLLERANMIGKGEVKDVLVRTLLFE